MARIMSRATGDLRRTSSSRLSVPMPCSAEIEPPRAVTASYTSAWMSCSQRLRNSLAVSFAGPWTL
jgi:hypothetical protein